MSLINEVMQEYYKKGTHQRLGQFFFNTYVKVSDKSTEGIFHEGDINKARVLIAQFIADNQWHALPKELTNNQPTASRFLCVKNEGELL